jgi:3-oxoacyl-[acyl-carrier-protein] synthase II
MIEPIVITGTGLACSLGLDAEQTWQGVLQGRSGISSMPALESAPPIDAGGYQAMELQADFAAALPREARYLRWTVRQAITQARAEAFIADQPRRCGVVLGTTLHGMRAGGAFLRNGGYALLRNFLAGNTLQRAIEGMGFAGDALTTCSACSSSLASIALAITLLDSGRLDLVVAGGYDTVSEYAFAGFNSLRLVTAGPLRPFAKDRKGMKLGEGYGIVVLERSTDAERRGVEPVTMILGCGESSDAHHLTQPHPRGEGAAAAIRAALADAQISSDSIGLISAHATGTPDNDAGEYKAYANVFGVGLRTIPIVALKSHVGHTLGGAGAVELILTAMALRDQTVPTTANTAPADVEFAGLSLVTDAPRPAKIEATLNTSLGFGGANACMILSRAKTIIGRPREMREVCISGVGVVLPGAIGNDAFVRRLTEAPTSPMRDTGNIPEEQYVHLLNARRVRRMSDYVKFTLAAARLALADAGVADDPAFASSCSAILGSTHAGAAYCVSYYEQIVREGMAAANPMLFAEGVPNAAAAHLSLMLSLKGACQTLIGTRTAGLDALRLAFLRIASGRWDRAIVSAGEEFVPTVNNAYAHCGLHNPDNGRGAFGSLPITPSPGSPGEGWGEGDFEHQQHPTSEVTLTPPALPGEGVRRSKRWARPLPTAAVLRSAAAPSRLCWKAATCWSSGGESRGERLSPAAAECCAPDMPSTTWAIL